MPERFPNAPPVNPAPLNNKPTLRTFPGTLPPTKLRPVIPGEMTKMLSRLSARMILSAGTEKPAIRSRFAMLSSLKKSFPAPPVRESSPKPPSRVSLPRPPLMVSLPAPPLIKLAEALPVTESLPAPILAFSKLI
ncbi:hypothetical protein MAE_33820 [Microcystis aeruginosa NIES-843]|uniref:Uncharacterized protein n=1 Tax=Microcystis aeruginosa (strain NIES-843 / IAM M-2473) TaxID=449447 RepID=B0JMB9_MICAN|nr:hypothetical protein MAE_33820 [Microcystis aeruginosa NIES-843]